MTNLHLPALSLALSLLAPLLSGQTPAASPAQTPAANPAQDTIRVDVPVVFVPVTVSRQEGGYMDGLAASDFQLTDNGRSVPFDLTTTDTLSAPLALVVAVQTNEGAMTALEKIRKVGSVVRALISGQRGSVMVLGYGGEVRTIQTWTRDANDLSIAFRSLKPQWTAKARMLDAVKEGIGLLARRAPEERRVLMVVGETKDRGSKTGLREVAEAAQREGVIIHGVTYSAYTTAFTKKGAQTPGSSTGGFNVLGLFTEVGRLGKENTMEALALASGGRRRGFTTQDGLEEELGRVGEEIHSQYLLSFTPVTPKPGFHQLIVTVKNRKDVLVRTRPGYWAGETAGQTKP